MSILTWLCFDVLATRSSNGQTDNEGIACAGVSGFEVRSAMMLFHSTDPL